MTKQGWVAAEDLCQETVVQTESGVIVEVDRVDRREGAQQVDNFRVEGFHTYFVSELGLLVHNQCGRDLVDPHRQTHILDGDQTGGGHRPGTGKPGKTEFPQGWSDDDILDAIADVATNPNSTWVQQTGSQGARFTRSGQPVRWSAEGTVNGVNIRVIVEPDGTGIVTGHPTNLPRNP